MRGQRARARRHVPLMSIRRLFLLWCIVTVITAPPPGGGGEAPPGGRWGVGGGTRGRGAPGGGGGGGGRRQRDGSPAEAAGRAKQAQAPQAPTSPAAARAGGAGLGGGGSRFSRALFTRWSVICVRHGDLTHLPSGGLHVQNPAPVELVPVPGSPRSCSADVCTEAGRGQAVGLRSLGREMTESDLAWIPLALLIVLSRPLAFFSRQGQQGPRGLESRSGLGLQLQCAQPPQSVTAASPALWGDAHT